MALLLYVLSYRGGRGEFSLDSLVLRARSERFLFGIRVYCSAWQESRPELVEFLIQEGYWSVRKSGEPRWVLAFAWSEGSRDGQAVWYRELVWLGFVWVEWTRDQPDIARDLWPLMLEVFRSAQQGRGGVAGHILFLAKRSRDADDFVRAVQSARSDPDLSGLYEGFSQVREPM